MCVEYLHALVLIRLSRSDEAREVLRRCLNHYPRIARHILEDLPQPPSDGILGYVTYGSEYEGWLNAQEFGFLWRRNPVAMDVLRAEAKPFEERNWGRSAQGA